MTVKSKSAVAPKPANAEPMAKKAKLKPKVPATQHVIYQSPPIPPSHAAAAKAGFFAGVTAVALGIPTALILGATHLPKLFRRR